METIQKLFTWWYMCYPDLATGLKICWCLGAIGGTGYFLYMSWTDKLNKSHEGPILGTLQILMFSFIGSFFLWGSFPLIIIIGTLYLINGGLSKWGNNYRALEKSKEKRREETLQAMLDSDPVFMQKYKELMNSTPKI
jgi:hypothetical protein